MGEVGLAEGDSQGLFSGEKCIAHAFIASLFPPSTRCPSVVRAWEGGRQDVRVRLEPAERGEGGAVGGGMWHWAQSPPLTTPLAVLSALCALSQPPDYCPQWSGAPPPQYSQIPGMQGGGKDGWVGLRGETLRCLGGSQAWHLITVTWGVY